MSDASSLEEVAKRGGASNVGLSADYAVEQNHTIANGQIQRANEIRPAHDGRANANRQRSNILAGKFILGGAGWLLDFEGGMTGRINGVS